MLRICYDEDLLLCDDHIFIPKSYLRVRGLHSFGYAKFDHAKRVHGDHVHPGCMEITVMVGGSQKYGAGEEIFFLHAGDVLFNFADEVHNTGGEPQSVSEFYLIELDMRIVDGFGELCPPFDRLLHEKVISWKKRLLHISPEDIALCREAFQCFETLIKDPEN